MTLNLEPEDHFGKTYEHWSEIPQGNVVLVHGKGFYMRIGSEDFLFTGQKNGPTKGWMIYDNYPRGPFREVNRIGYAGN